ncbi:integrase catalytic domain-containing protein [Trichonephila clavipes]|nr:integrase catalytic domain-containing protein [Trichonephila clavipes]
MDLKAQKAQRRVLRTAVTLSANKIESELKNDVVDLQKISLLQVQLKDKYLRLEAAQEAVSGTLLQLEDNGEEFETDFIDAESYREKYLEYYTRIDKKLGETVISEVPDTPRKFKLPKLELRKFGGDPKEFLSFWSQFQKIHDDGSIPNEDKMQYLVASVEPKSKAERLILSFPATAANYPKAVDQLKERFGREDLLVQIYVRDLLTMVMKNAVSGRAKTDLSRLYDELEGKLRALESLGRTQERFGDFLAPLVESCLPEEVLMTWERNRNHHELSDNTAGKNIRSLENLMTFLRQEVQGEEMVVLSRTGFASNNVTRKKEYVCTPLNEISGDPATAAALTLCVIARGRGRERRIRIILDSASQYSHVSERLIAHLGLIPHRYENVIHSLFGGTQTKPKKHGVYSIELTALNGDYSCCLEVLSEEKICDSVPKITDEQILNNLRELNIEFSDSFSEDLEIDLLVAEASDSSNGRYELQLPWKHDPVNLPDNKGLTWARHEKVIKRAESNGFLREYQKVFEDWENLGIIEIVPEEEVKAVKCHYLAHRPIIKLQSETTKYRPCFDGSACENGKPSLNQCLYKGINLLEVIPDILDRFRLYPIGLSADIEKAFLMLSVHPKDRDYLRFFYPSKEELVYRHCRIVFGLNSSPFLLNASIKHLLDNAPLEYCNVVEKLKSSFYVDNCLSGVNNVKEQENFIDIASKLLSKGCFNLRGWQSNVASKYVSQHTGEASVLGMLWNLDKDTLRCNINFEILTCETKITKRFILSTVQKVFDANGLLSPATLPPKLLLQETWKLKLPWDSELPKNIVNKFMKWSNEMYLLKEVTVPRYITINETSELHIFVDASKSSYGACVFVRTVVENDLKVTLLRSKARVAPLKSLTIPRLELMSCCLGARLANSIIRALNLPGIKVIYWSDSEVALWWIRERGNWSVFVANRVKEIRELTQFQSWRHVPSNMNIADLLSRGCTPQKMLDSKWWEGPRWLRNNREQWPANKIVNLRMLFWKKGSLN